jgi:hypothetical protein
MISSPLVTITILTKDRDHLLGPLLYLKEQQLAWEGEHLDLCDEDA